MLSPQLSEPALAHQSMRPLLVKGMHGRGDCLHSRALLKQWLKRREVWLTSSWVSIFHDLVPLGLHIIREKTPLRTQTKNAEMEAGSFDTQKPPAKVDHQRIWYRPEEVRRHGSVLAAMCKNSGCDYLSADFRLPVPSDWRDELCRVFDWTAIQKPLAIYRPLCTRPEWGGHDRRNPDPEAFRQLFERIRSRFYWVSVADLCVGREWLVGPQPQVAIDGYSVDLKLHHGDLDSRQMSALFAAAKLVFTPGGFPVILGQAVETPVIAIMGGYEDHRSYLGGARFSPYLGIDPIKPCQCFSHHHPCQKAIDLPKAHERIEQFLTQLKQ